MSGSNQTKREELQGWLRLIRAKNYILRERPSLLFQEATNEPDGTSVAVVGRQRWESGREKRPWIKWGNKPQHTDPCIMTLDGHSDNVRACAYSPDGKQIVSASDDLTLRIWDAQTGDHLSTLTGHSGWVTACAYSPDGRRIASGSLDGTVRIWDADSGEFIMVLPRLAGSVRACAYAPDGSRIVSQSHEGILRVWNSDSGEPADSRSPLKRAHWFSPLANPGVNAWATEKGFSAAC